MGLKVREYSAEKNGVNIDTVENLKCIIKNIAQCHACEICNNEKNESVNNCDISVKKIATQVISLDMFEALDIAAAEEQIQFLEDSIQKVIAEGVLVKNQGIEKPVPLGYEVLSLIFAQTNEKFRQQYFHELIDYYYSELHRILKKVGCNYILQRQKFDIQVKFLLPVVKFEILLELDGNDVSQKLVNELFKNISNFFKSPRMNQEDIYVVAKNKIGSNDFDLISYKFIPLNERNGHLGEYFQLKIDVRRENSLEKLQLFAKFLTPKAAILQSFVERGVSKKEEFFYMVYLQKLREHGLSELLDFAPKFYFSRVNDVLILDNMSVLGFVGLTPNNKLEYDTLKLVVREIAKFHACTFILEETLSKQEGRRISLYDLYGEYLQEMLLLYDNEEMKQGFQHSTDTILFLASEFPELTNKYSQEQLQEKAQNGWKMATEKVKRSDKFRNTICHGDMYVANMLFKFDENKVCQAVKLIDFQILRYCPPTQDLLFFLYQNAFRKTLEDHKVELIEEYYNVLSTYLEKYHLDITEVYPREDFDASSKYMQSEAIFQSLLYLPMQIIEPKVREALFQDEEAMKRFREDKLGLVKIGLQDDAYRRVMRGLIESFIDLCDNGDI